MCVTPPIYFAFIIALSSHVLITLHSLSALFLSPALPPSFSISLSLSLLLSLLWLSLSLSFSLYLSLSFFGISCSNPATTSISVLPRFCQGMIKAIFTPQNRMSYLELSFDVMSFMQQLRRASGKQDFQVKTKIITQ